jgi:hypothetical protein
VKLEVKFGLLLVVLFGVGCQPSIEQKAQVAEHQRIRITNWNETRLAQKERAEGARGELFGKLTARLMEVLTSGGPIAAISVCQTAAPELAAEVSRDGVAIGRTSFQLRNTLNQPPDWAVDFVNRKIREPVFVSLEEERMGALFPIKLLDTCVICHGKLAEIGDDVAAAIQEHYPHDQATGFSPGDLRGYFWVEVQ